ncbi:MAG: aldo/keto reductase [Vicinamibacterales bacterium]|nr:aldo/keto reductase [Vicinamibacterales bacterium]
MEHTDVTRREFVKMGNVRLFSLGGQATIEKEGTRDASLAIINRAIDLGVNYIDTAAAYGKGISQTYIGEVMATRRREVLLASKTHDRTRDGSLRLLEQSLELLRTDHLDLWQLHNVRFDEQVDQIFGKDGAIEALVQAREQKMVRFLGITGHYDPDVLARAIEKFPFDTVLMALNPADRHRLSFIERLLPLANRKGMGVIGMKIPARGRIFKEGAITSIRPPLRYVLSLPISTVIIGCDNVEQLEENVAVARAFSPMPEAEMRALEQTTRSYEADAAWFKKAGTGFSAALFDDQNTD